MSSRPSSASPFSRQSSSHHVGTCFDETGWHACWENALQPQIRCPEKRPKFARSSFESTAGAHQHPEIEEDVGLDHRVRHDALRHHPVENDQLRSLSSSSAPLSLVFREVASVSPATISAIAIVATLNTILAQMIMAASVICVICPLRVVEPQFIVGCTFAAEQIARANCRQQLDQTIACRWCLQVLDNF